MYCLITFAEAYSNKADEFTVLFSITLYSLYLYKVCRFPVIYR